MSIPLLNASGCLDALTARDVANARAEAMLSLQERIAAVGAA